LGALDAWNFGFAAFVFGAWGLLLFVFWRFFGFASFLFFVLELWFCFFCVLHDGKLCICEVFFLLAFRGWRGKGNRLLLEKTFSNGTSSLASKQCQQPTSNGLEIMIL
jgi:hypothetical protein